MWQRQKPDRCVNVILCKAYSILQPKMSTNKHCHTYQEGQPCLNKWLGFWTDRSKEERVLKQRPKESYSEGDSTLINPKTNEKSDVLNLIHSITYTHSVFKWMWKAFYGVCHSDFSVYIYLKNTCSHYGCKYFLPLFLSFTLWWNMQTNEIAFMREDFKFQHLMFAVWFMRRVIA